MGVLFLILTEIGKHRKLQSRTPRESVFLERSLGTSLHSKTLHFTFSHSVSSVAQSCQTLRPHGLQHARLPCLSLSPRVCSNSCPLSRRCHPATSSSVIPFSCFQSFPAPGSFPMSQPLASGGQSIAASASVLPMNIQD